MTQDEIQREREAERLDNLERWTTAIRRIFPVSVPKRAIWEDIDSIVATLSEIRTEIVPTHLFMPDGGGYHHDSIELGSEPGSIVLNRDSAVLVAPRLLAFEGSDHEDEWSYFWLECGPIEGTQGNLKDQGMQKESVTEVEPGVYRAFNVWDQGFIDYDEDGHLVDLPENARPLKRIGNCSIVFFAERSIYNKLSVAYDAPHQKMGSEQFRAKIAELATRAATSS